MLPDFVGRGQRQTCELSSNTFRVHVLMRGLSWLSWLSWLFTFSLCVIFIVVLHSQSWPRIILLICLNDTRDSVRLKGEVPTFSAAPDGLLVHCAGLSWNHLQSILPVMSHFPKVISVLPEVTCFVCFSPRLYVKRTHTKMLSKTKAAETVTAVWPIASCASMSKAIWSKSRNFTKNWMKNL